MGRTRVKAVVEGPMARREAQRDEPKLLLLATHKEKVPKKQNAGVVLPRLHRKSQSPWSSSLSGPSPTTTALKTTQS